MTMSARAKRVAHNDLKWPPIGEAEWPNLKGWPVALRSHDVTPENAPKGLPWITVILGPEAGYAEPSGQSMGVAGIVGSAVGTAPLSAGDDFWRQCKYPTVLLPKPIGLDSAIPKDDLETIIRVFWEQLCKDRVPIPEMPAELNEPHATDVLVATALLSRAATSVGVLPRYEDSALALDWTKTWAFTSKAGGKPRLEACREWVEKVAKQVLKQIGEEQDIHLDKSVPVFVLRAMLDRCWLEQLNLKNAYYLKTWADWQLELLAEGDAGNGWLVHGSMSRARFASDNAISESLTKLDDFPRTPGDIHSAAADLVRSLAEYSVSFKAENIPKTAGVPQNVDADMVKTRTPPPAASIFTTSFDLLIERELSKTGPYLVVMPVYVGTSTGSFGLWVGRLFQRGDDPQSPTTGENKWLVISLLSENDFRGDYDTAEAAHYFSLVLGDTPLSGYPIVIHLLGCPLINTPAKAERSFEFNEHINQVIHNARIAGDHGSTTSDQGEGITHAIQLTDSDVLRWSVGDSAGKVANQGRITTALPLPLAAGTSDGSFFRYWVFLGVPFGDSATRFSVLSKILTADFVHGDATPKLRGMSVGSFRLSHRATETLMAENIEFIYGHTPTDLAPFLRHYTIHIRAAIPAIRRGYIQWPIDDSECAACVAKSNKATRVQKKGQQ